MSVSFATMPLLLGSLLLTGCIQTKLMRWAHEEVKFVDLSPDSDNVWYGTYESPGDYVLIFYDGTQASWPSNELGIRIDFWVKNIESWEDGRYRLRIPAGWDSMDSLTGFDGKFRQVSNGVFEPVVPVRVVVERTKVPEGTRWGQGRQGDFLLDLQSDPIRAEERRDWQLSVRGGFYGVVSHTRIEGGRRHHLYVIYGYHEGLGAWVKLRTLRLPPGTQWPYRRWVAIPLSILAFPLDVCLFLPRWLITPGGPPLPEDLY